MRYLCIDLGDQRTGLAVGDDQTGVALPLELLEVPIDQRQGEALIDAVLAAIAAQFSALAAFELVVGLPLNMDGTEGPRTKVVRAFVKRLETRLAPPRTVHFQDERLSTVQADARMARTGLTHKQKKARRDAIAAGAILEAFLRPRMVGRTSDMDEPRPTEGGWGRPAEPRP